MMTPDRAFEKAALTTRRRMLKGIATLSGLVASPFSLFNASALADPSTPLVKRVVRSPDNTYFTYPHSNGFLADGRAVVAIPSKNSQGIGVDYLTFDLITGETKPLAHVKGALTYYAISRSNMMAVPVREGLVLVDLNGGGEPKKILDCPGWTLHGDCDISADGSKALITRSHYAAPQQYRTDLIDIATGEITAVTSDWQTDHAHFSPFDPSWVCFCDDRPNNDDRLWVWHAQQAPRGKHLFHQTDSQGKTLQIGHERAMFDKAALIVIAYGSSSATPRGLYEVGFNGDVRLVSESNSDFHVNVSRDGRWAVVSSQGEVVTDKKLTPDVQTRAKPDWLTQEGTYGDSDVSLVNLKTGARQFLYRGHNDAKGQPYEVQPSISPDGRWVLLKDGRERKVLALELDQSALSDFLK